MIDICKFEYFFKGNTSKVTGRKYLGPRGKKMSGTGKALARVVWDRARFSTQKPK